MWVTSATDPSRYPVVPASDDGDALGELLGTPALPSRRPARPVWRRLHKALSVAVLLGVATSAYLWLAFRSQHVMSKNAAVRGHVAEIGSRLSGLVSSVAVDIGDRVKARQVLVRLENRHLRAEVQEARAGIAALQRMIDVERATVKLERLQIESRGPESSARITAAKAKAEAVRIEVQAARRHHAMQAALHSRDRMVSDQILQAALSDLQAAEARLEEAQANAVVVAQSSGQTERLARDAVAIRAQKIAVLEAEHQAAQARLARAEADVESAAIRAPDDGAIVRRIVQPGAAIDAGQPVLSMWLGNELWVEAWIDEDDLSSVRHGSKATVTFNSLRGREFAGVVDRVGLATDLEIPDAAVPQPRSSRMRAAPVVSVRIRLVEPPLDLVPGMSAIVSIEKRGDAR